MISVGSTSWPVSARMISERCGWLCASSAVIRPSSTRVWTKVSSLVICVEFAVAQQVAAGVADVDQAKPVAREQDCGQRGAHALELGIGFDMRGDRGVALVDGVVELAEQVAAGLVVVEMGQRGDHQLRGHLAGGVAAHAVGQRQQPGTGVHRVLVVGAHQAAVAARCVSQNECHGRNSITVLPIRTGVPIGTRTAVVTFALSRYVPLVDPRSSTYHSEPRWRQPGVACRGVIVGEHQGGVVGPADQHRLAAQGDAGAGQRARR